MSSTTQRSDGIPMPLDVSDFPEGDAYAPAGDVAASSADVFATAANENTVSDLGADVEQFEVAETAAVDIAATPHAVEAVEAAATKVAHAAAPEPVADAIEAAESVEAVEAAEPIAAAPQEAAAKPAASTQASAARTQAACDTTLSAPGETSEALAAAADGASISATKLALKWVEFAQANVRNTFDFACDCVSVRSLPDALAAQTAYAQRQVQLLTTQIEELRALTSQIATVAGKPFTGRAPRD